MVDLCIGVKMVFGIGGKKHDSDSLFLMVGKLKINSFKV
jgi:hypothetical protein